MRAPDERREPRDNTWIVLAVMIAFALLVLLASRADS